MFINKIHEGFLSTLLDNYLTDSNNFSSILYIITCKLEVILNIIINHDFT